jgi:Transposase DDE domain
VNSKKHGEAVMSTTFESPRDHGMPLVTRTPQALKRGRRDLPNRAGLGHVCPPPRHHEIDNHWKQLDTESIYIIDSFPIAVCDNYQNPRAKLYQHEEYRGCIASKKRYFYGLKVHLLVTKDGQPVECLLTPGSYSDVRMLKAFRFDVPEGSHVYADKAYNDYALEDVLLEASQVRLYPIRKKGSKRSLPPYIAYVQHYYRKRIETVGSLIEQMLPKTIHAVTAEGFELKVFLFVLAYSLNCL